MKTDLIRFIVSQTAAEVSVAPGEGLAPSRGNQNFVLLDSEDTLVGAHDLAHRLLQLWTRVKYNREERDVSAEGIYAPWGIGAVQLYGQRMALNLSGLERV